MRAALGRGSLSVVAGALRHWREGLRRRLRGEALAPRLPLEILEYVRLGYEAAKRLGGRWRSQLDGCAVQGWVGRGG